MMISNVTVAPALGTEQSVHSPAENTFLPSVLTRVEDVGHGAIVHDDGLRDLPVQQRQVLHVVAWR